MLMIILVCDMGVVMVDKYLIKEVKKFNQGKYYISEYPTKCKEIRRKINLRTKFKLDFLHMLLEQDLITQSVYNQFEFILKNEQRKFHLCISGYLTLEEML